VCQSDFAPEPSRHLRGPNCPPPPSFPIRFHLSSLVCTRFLPIFPPFISGFCCCGSCRAIEIAVATTRKVTPRPDQHSARLEHPPAWGHGTARRRPQGAFRARNSSRLPSGMPVRGTDARIEASGDSSLNALASERRHLGYGGARPAGLGVVTGISTTPHSASHVGRSWGSPE